MNNYAQNEGEKFYKDRISNNKVNPKVYDIMHKYLPEIKKYEWINNGIILIALIPLFMESNLQLYLDFSLLLLVVNFIRDITINLTILPKNKNCELDNISEVYKQLAGGCYDQIFSGHFAFVYLLSLIYYNNNIITNIPFLVIYNLLNSFVILTTRSHYTIDIVVSYFICTLVYMQYNKYS